MTAPPENPGHEKSRKTAAGTHRCPACGTVVKADARWCPECGFTGGDTMELFSASPPPLLPVLDAADIFVSEDIRHIENARDAVSRDFPQFRWRVCTVALPADTSLPLFGFWLLNACPLLDGESREQRTWTILLLINAGTGQAAVIPGYAAEPYLSDDDWKNVMGVMAEPWSAGRSTDAVIRFFKRSAELLKQSWKRHGNRQPSP